MRNERGRPYSTVQFCWIKSKWPLLPITHLKYTVERKKHGQSEVIEKEKIGFHDIFAANGIQNILVNNDQPVRF